MTRFKNYLNSVTREPLIYSDRDLMQMPVSDALDNELSILAQNKQIGIPSFKELSSSSNVVWVDSYTRDDGVEVRGHWRSKPEGGSSTGGASGMKGEGLLPQKTNPVILDERDKHKRPEYTFNPVKSAFLSLGEEVQAQESPQGEADVAQDKSEKQNNDVFFDEERDKKGRFLMKYNAEKNIDRPDAKLFMDIALVHPKKVPSCSDYIFIASDKVKEINEKYKLEGNKKIKEHYDGFVFSENSPTVQRLNDSLELKDEIFSDKNYDKQKGCFKSDKLEIEFKKDKNLGYS